jgi:hypothetical protein
MHVSYRMGECEFGNLFGAKPLPLTILGFHCTSGRRNQYGKST